MSVRKQIDAYLEGQGHIRESTKSLYKIVLDKLNAFCDKEGIDNLDKSFVNHMDAYVAFIISIGAKGKTIQSYLTITRSFFRAIGHEIKYTYRLTPEDKKDAQFKSINRWFTEEEIQKCLGYKFAKNHDRNALIIRILHETGVRVNELAQIRLKDIGTDPQKIMIGESKTQIRYVFISPNTASMLKCYVSKTFDNHFLIYNPYDKLFGVTVGQIKKIVTSMLEDLDIKSEGRGPHTFRHWCATWLFYEGNMRLEDIAFLLGDTPEQIKTTYLNPTPDMMLKRVSIACGW